MERYEIASGVLVRPFSAHFEVLLWYPGQKTKEETHSYFMLKPWDENGLITTNGTLSPFCLDKDILPLIEAWWKKFPPTVNTPIYKNAFAEKFQKMGVPLPPEISEERAGCLWAFVQLPACVRPSRECYLEAKELSFLKKSGLLK